MLLLLSSRRLERVEVIPPGNGSTGLWEGRSYSAHQPKKGTGLNPAGPALAKPQGHQKTLRSRGMWLILSTLGVQHGPSSAHLARVPREMTDSGISAEGKLGSQGSPLHWTDKTRQPCTYRLKPPVCSGNKSPSFSCWGHPAGKPARPPCATHCCP